MLVLDDDDATSAGGLAVGQIYSTDGGDPIDVFYEIDDSEMGCMSVGGSVAASSTAGEVSCFDPKEVEEGGTYKLVIPASAEMPALVVGIMPAGATGAIRSCASGGGRRERRPADSGSSRRSSRPTPARADLADIRVEFDY